MGIRNRISAFLDVTLPRWIAGKLSRKVIYFAAIRLMAYATSGKYSNTIVPELEGMEAIKRWEIG